ncbi:Molybdenum cofactor biosynthesis protein B [Pirellulimonas nuda]|uniref:Molybdenum cofactor biosynthesis protein B n=1 Tax=Pirellulimonas nuda TaxID=2528009 RepID=A0A518D6L2_9BACT|nr:molybdenum cofactor biosynthesis protein B [Pirellulimonas nuda]QDU87079.1 Molybdenum cofactor biosynthesis protein B [Pirellulimonas nuda]
MDQADNPTIPQQHRGQAPAAARCAVVTVSDTRTAETDRGGPLIVQMLEGAGHLVVRREIVADSRPEIEALVAALAVQADAVLVTGGTGIAPRDVTCEALTALFDKPMPGYGELFRMLSFQEIGAAAMLSRAVGGVVGRAVVLSMPGSPAAVRLAMERLVLPELAHLVWEARKGVG